MSLPLAICSHVYLKSSEVIGSLSDQTAFGLILYVTVCLPLTWVTVGISAIRMLGTFCQVPLASFSYSKTRGIVCSSISQTPQDEPAQLAIQSAQSISCSAPMTSVPLPFVGVAAAFVVDDVPSPPLLEPLELPQAASTMARIADMATRERRVRITRDLPVSRESG